MASDTLMALGLASTPSNCTWLPAAPRSCLASSMLIVVSGHTLVHCESTNERMTTLPRNWLSAMRWPNWLTRWMSGVSCPFSELPVSRAGLLTAAAMPLPESPELAEPGVADPAAPLAQAASTSAHAAPAAGRHTACHAVRGAPRLAERRGRLTWHRLARRHSPISRSCGGPAHRAPRARAARCDRAGTRACAESRRWPRWLRHTESRPA